MQTLGGHLLEQRPQPEAVTAATVDVHAARNAAQVEALAAQPVTGASNPLDELAARLDALEAAFKAHAQHG